VLFTLGCLIKLSRLLFTIARAERKTVEARHIAARRGPVLAAAGIVWVLDLGWIWCRAASVLAIVVGGVGRAAVIVDLEVLRSADDAALRFLNWLTAANILATGEINIEQLVVATSHLRFAAVTNYRSLSRMSARSTGRFIVGSIGGIVPCELSYGWWVRLHVFAASNFASLVDCRVSIITGIVAIIHQRQLLVKQLWSSTGRTFGWPATTGTTSHLRNLCCDL
jgi:hypothetical protein